MVVPEFNLTGWSPLAGVKEMDVPMLPEAALERWYELRSSATSLASRLGDSLERVGVVVAHRADPIRIMVCTGRPDLARGQ